MQKLNPNQIEEMIKKYFEYMSSLNKSIRNLRHEIKSETEKLNALLKEDKEYVDIITSMNTGRGKYHDISMLPYEIKTIINNNKDNSEEKIKELEEKYQLALNAENELKERYEQLSSTAKERTTNIRNHRKNIANNKRKLLKRQRDYESNFLHVKRLDKKLEKLPKITK